MSKQITTVSTDFNKMTCNFIGLGLIGGSIAKALRQTFPGMRLVGYDLDETSLSMAFEEGVLSGYVTELSDSLFDCDYLFLCAPVSRNDAMLAELKSRLKDGTIITDVGSVKQTTYKAITEAGLSSVFIGGHPMAGSEKTGYGNANPLLLENAYYILTPTPEVSGDKVDELKKMVSEMGALPLVIDCEKHDYITAAVSHVPHIIAAALVNLVKDSDGRDGLMKTIAAGGFKDITRISSSSPVMWQSVCLTNTDNILKLLTDYIQSLEEIKDSLIEKSEKEIYDFFDVAKEYRDSFVNGSHGPIKKVHAIFVDIPDVPGSLAKTATILADHNLSIKNIGIMHSREFQEGALRIEFYDEATVADATSVLRDKGYTLYE